MKKKRNSYDFDALLHIGAALVIIVVVGALILVGADKTTIVYKDKERYVTDVEEIIADELEVENPGLDIEINISTENDD